MGKVEIGVCFFVRVDILTQVFQNGSLHRKAKFSKQKKTKILLHGSHKEVMKLYLCKHHLAIYSLNNISSLLL